MSESIAGRGVWAERLAAKKPARGRMQARQRHSLRLSVYSLGHCAEKVVKVQVGQSQCDAYPKPKREYQRSSAQAAALLTVQQLNLLGHGPSGHLLT